MTYGESGDEAAAGARQKGGDPKEDTGHGGSHVTFWSHNSRWLGCTVFAACPSLGVQFQFRTPV